jgi:large subunit ribosomal protein L25
MTIEINATSRNAQGTGASRRLRHTGRALGVVYGLGDAVSIEMDHNEIYHKLRVEEVHASVLNLNLDGKVEPVMLRAFQMHPFRQQVLHLDFLRIDMAKPMHIKVPLHFINADIAPGVKTGGGKITHVMNELDVTCLPADLPGFVEVDLGKLEVGHSIHVADLVLPSGVTVSAHGRHTGELVVATIYVPRAVEAAPVVAADAKGKKGKK